MFSRISVNRDDSSENNELESPNSSRGILYQAETFCETEDRLEADMSSASSVSETMHSIWSSEGRFCVAECVSRNSGLRVLMGNMLPFKDFSECFLPPCPEQNMYKPHQNRELGITYTQALLVERIVCRP